MTPVPNTSGAIHLVRHAMPVIDPTVPPGRWRLDAAGNAAARTLRPRLPRDARFLSSTEPKAVDTATALADGEPVTVHSDLIEVGRPHLVDVDYRAVAAAYLGGTVTPDWEPHAEVVARFDGAIRESLAADTRPLVVVTHGLAMTLWIDTVLDIGDRVAWWRRLGFPELVTVPASAIDGHGN
ncbi:histidine phosphatase family protein [Stackebrandtia soli]|uniref:histidine phosphatase family protein n=1 Tax=Stackebrandtia soli TaxID=1892856 RepID=UPI0039EA6D5A